MLVLFPKEMWKCRSVILQSNHSIYNRIKFYCEINYICVFYLQRHFFQKVNVIKSWLQEYTV